MRRQSHYARVGSKLTGRNPKILIILAPQDGNEIIAGRCRIRGGGRLPQVPLISCNWASFEGRERDTRAADACRATSACSPTLEVRNHLVQRRIEITQHL